MAIFKTRVRPESWPLHRARAPYRWMVPLFALEWVWLWIAYVLSGWAFLEVLEYMGTLSVLLAVVSYFAESKDRVKLRHYQAWQVINSAQSKGGSGGRIDALEELLADGIPLIGVDVNGAFLQGIDLPKADLTRANFSGSDVRGGNLEGARLEYADLGSGNFRGANLAKARFEDCFLQDADMTGANFSDAVFDGANLSRADLRLTDWRNAKWRKIANLKLANIFGIKNPPVGFIDWATQEGAVSLQSDAEWQLLLKPE